MAKTKSKKSSQKKTTSKKTKQVKVESKETNILSFRNKNKKFYVPFTFVIIVIGIILLQADWMPFLGWIYVLMAFTSGLASLIKANENRIGKSGAATMALGLSVLVLLILVLALPVINNAYFKTYLDVKVVLFYLF